MEYLRQMFDIKNPKWWRRLICMILGIVIMGIGVSLFKLSLMGNDPCCACVMAIGDKVGLSFTVTLIIANSTWFIVEILLSRHMIGVGTFFNWFGLGVFTDLWLSVIQNSFTVPTSFPGRLVVMAIGVLVQSFACAFYQTADMGIAPYDALSLTLAARTPIPYFWCRMITDCICAVLAWAFGGIVGLGTLISVFGMGPFVAFFTRTVACRLCGVPAPEDKNAPGK